VLVLGEPAKGHSIVSQTESAQLTDNARIRYSWQVCWLASVLLVLSS